MRSLHDSLAGGRSLTPRQLHLMGFAQVIDHDVEYSRKGLQSLQRKLLETLDTSFRPVIEISRA